MTTTLVELGKLETRSTSDWQTWGEDHDRYQNQGGILGGIPGVPMLNDGKYANWLPTSGVVVLECRDGVWRVDHPDPWFAGHELRLELGADPHLPTLTGPARLSLDHVYEVHHRSDADTRSLGWWLYQRA